jgi:predicted TIM-barrel fold metal-dependent hydrolase
MPTIDAQVHAYERDHSDRPWVEALTGPPAVTGDDMVAAMDAVGVDGALLVSVFAMYRFDASYALEVHAKHPNRFALIKPIDPNDPASAETVADWAEHDGTVGVRIMMRPEVSEAPDDPGINRIAAAAARHGLPLNLACSGRLPQVGEIAARNPNTRIVVDHLGIKQPHHPPVPDEPFADLPQLLDLATHDNVVVKVTGACTLSCESSPFEDIWDPLARVFDTFGFERCLWGTDWTRAINMVSYEEGVEPFRLTDRLSDSERAALMGGSLKKVYGWVPGAG